jgi:hypothetical protein
VVVINTNNPFLPVRGGRGVCMIEEGFVSVAPFLKPFSSNDEGLLLEK